MPKTDDSHLHQIPVFADVPVKQLAQLRSLLTTVRTSKQTAVVRQGSIGLEFLVLTAGSATVLRDGEVVATLTAGDAFGEQALLDGGTRNATVVVDAGAELLAANLAEFRSIIDTFPQVAEKLVAISAARN